MSQKMKAIGFTEHLPIENENSLIDIIVDKPISKGRDLLVKVEAVSVNPVDIGVRSNGRGQLLHPKVIGWDAVGTVVSIGNLIQNFKVGDKVFYAGSFKRSGSNSEYQLVDERIVGKAPTSIDNSEIAAMPLTSLTAYEALFEQMNLELSGNAKVENLSKTILIINGAGGVGSIATQLAKLAGLTVITIASRKESISWCKQHGAEYVVNHRNDLVKQVRNVINGKYVDYILGLSDLDGHWNEICELIKPAGQIVSITENRKPIDLKKLTKKRGKFSWEWMYSKSFYKTYDMGTQGEILNLIAELLDSNQITSTLTKKISPINAENLRLAHKLVESHHMIGKVVVAN